MDFSYPPRPRQAQCVYCAEPVGTLIFTPRAGALDRPIFACASCVMSAQNDSKARRMLTDRLLIATGVFVPYRLLSDEVQK